MHEKTSAKVLQSREPGTCTFASTQLDRLIVKLPAFESWYADNTSPNAVTLIVDGLVLSCPDLQYPGLPALH
jgi:hypothetical protein